MPVEMHGMPITLAKNGQIYAFNTSSLIFSIPPTWRRVMSVASLHLMHTTGPTYLHR